MKTNKIRINKRKIKALRRELIRRHKLIGSWRIMARELYKDEINYATLRKFAMTDFLPSDERLLKLLGLITPPSPYRNLPRWYNRIPEALAYFNRKREQIKEMSVNTKKAARGIR